MTKTLTTLLIVLGILAAALAAYVFWLLHIESMSIRVAELSSQVRERSSEIDRIEEARRTLSSLTEDEARFQQYFVPAEDIAPFFARIERTGRELGSTVEILSVTDDKGAPRRMLTLSTKISGSYSAVMRTVGAIEYGPYFSSLDSIAMQYDGTQWSAMAVYTIGADTRTTP